MALRLPPLPSLRLFEAAARHQSFTRAAEELGLTPSAVSHGIDALENWLEVPLFKRGKTRGVTLTPAGREYMPYVSEALSMIATGSKRLPGRRAKRLVSVSVAPTFASRWLIPRLPAFRRLHPAVRISIDTAHRQSTLPVDDVDIAIRMGRSGWPNTSSELLFRESLTPIAEPALAATLRRRGRPDWSAETLIAVTSVENDWAAWSAATGEGTAIEDFLQFDNIGLAMEAAMTGLGVAMGRLPLLQSALDSNLVATASDAIVPIDTGYWVVTMPGEETRTDVRSFKRWLLSEARGFGPPPPREPNR